MISGGAIVNFAPPYVPVGPEPGAQFEPSNFRDPKLTRNR